MEFAGAFYVNVFLKKNYIAFCIANIALKVIQISKVEKRRVIVDFSSPNIAKEVHVGTYDRRLLAIAFAACWNMCPLMNRKTVLTATKRLKHTPTTVLQSCTLTKGKGLSASTL
ncbi:unnamed protein product [Gongylonema pulchrum]|uniref:Arginyl-tRNA synthetase n=1 Tax=Gongylonema pulchrum TaxID=637853 RepID=A0A183E7L5_9BILA|nr:unnamed protein product [Gongylonema pulchrum]